jgi:hypothetical protein
MKCVRNKFLVKLQMKKCYWMLANVLLNIKHQHGDFKIRNDEVDCFNKCDWKPAYCNAGAR